MVARPQRKWRRRKERLQNDPCRTRVCHHPGVVQSSFYRVGGDRQDGLHPIAEQWRRNGLVQQAVQNQDGFLAQGHELSQALACPGGLSAIRAGCDPHGATQGEAT